MAKKQIPAKAPSLEAVTTALRRAAQGKPAQLPTLTPETKAFHLAAANLIQELEGARQEIATLQEASATMGSDFEETQKLAHVGVWEWDIRDNSVTYSAELCRILGREQGFTSTYRELLAGTPSGDRKRLRETLVAARESGRPFALQYQVRHGDGSVRFVWTRGRAHRHSRKVVKVTGVVQDVTAEVLSQRQLDQHARELERVNQLMINRELRMIELKQRIKELEGVAA
jgi:PAS domain S-box-containing protein